MARGGIPVYFCNPRFIISGFIKAGISEALDAGRIAIESAEAETITDNRMDSDSFPDVEDSDVEEVDMDSD